MHRLLFLFAALTCVALTANAATIPTTSTQDVRLGPANNSERHRGPATSPKALAPAFAYQLLIRSAKIMRHTRLK